MTQHTPEPRRMPKPDDWRTGIILGAFGSDVAVTVGQYGEVNRRRIIACVNACAGIHTDVLETGSKLIHDFEKVKQQRDDLDRRATEYALQCNQYAALNAELLAEMENALSNMEAPGIARAILRKAIAKAMEQPKKAPESCKIGPRCSCKQHRGRQS